MLNFNSLLIFSDNPEKLSEFYGKVFDKKPAMEGEGYTSFELGPGWITIGPHDKVHGKNSSPERIMFNLETKDVKGEFDRMTKAGAEVVKEPYQMEGMGDGWIATLKDPDDNIFQLMSPFEDMGMEKN